MNLKQRGYHINSVTVRRSKGLTLIELLISIALIGIIMSAAFSLQIFGTKTFKRGEDRADNQFDTRMASEFITKEIRYAKSLEILSSIPTPASGFNYIFISGGRLQYYKNGIKINPPGIGDVSDFTLSFSRVFDNTAGFKVGKQGSTDFDLDTRVSILNIGNASPYKIKDYSGGTGIGVRYMVGDLSDKDAVEADKAWLDIANPTDITSSIYLPAEGPNKTTITWASSNTAVVSSNGTVTRPSGADESVILTATITKGTATAAKTFNLVVKKLDSSLYIVSIKNLSDTVDQYDPYVLPATVEVQMNDGSVQIRPINWVLYDINTSTTGIKWSYGLVSGYGYYVTLTLTVKGVSPPTGQISSSSSSTQLVLVFNKPISSLNIVTNTTGKTCTTSISSNTVTINFSGSVSNNRSISIKTTSTDGGFASYTYVYKSNLGWK